MKKLIITCLSTLLCTSGFSFAETYVVEAYTMTFVPDVVNVAPGDVIRWEYVTGYPHDVTSGTKCKDDGYLFLDIPSGGSVEWTVPDDAPSEIPYFCTLHCGNGMTGMINVETMGSGGAMYIGVVDITNCEYEYTESNGTATMSIDGVYEGSFVLGVEIEVADVDVEVLATTKGGSVLYMYDVSSDTSSELMNGTYTLTEGQRYMFHGSANNSSMFEFSLTWGEEGDPEGFTINSLAGTANGSLSASGDTIMIRASSSGIAIFNLIANQDIVVPMVAIANVTCDTLTFPANGDDGDVQVPAGTHTIVINGGLSEVGVLIIEMGDGDDDDGLPEDVNGDGVVNVNDLLAIIGAWGATSP